VLPGDIGATRMQVALFRGCKRWNRRLVLARGDSKPDHPLIIMPFVSRSIRERMPIHGREEPSSPSARIQPGAALSYINAASLFAL